MFELGTLIVPFNKTSDSLTILSVPFIIISYKLGRLTVLPTGTVIFNTIPEPLTLKAKFQATSGSVVHEVYGLKVSTRHCKGNLLLAPLRFLCVFA
jgi:hypothetical protein